MQVKKSQMLVAASALGALAFLLGYTVAPKEILDQEVKYTGPMTVDTARVLSATVESIKAESKLIPFSYRGTASVNIDRDAWLIFEGHQQLTIPATVTYFVDLAELKDSDVTYDATRNEVTVLLPRLMLTVAFDPWRAIEINTGTLTFSDSVVQELRKLNYAIARKAMVKQGQQPEFVRLAKENAQKDVESFFRVPLRIAGKGNVNVKVEFRT